MKIETESQTFAEAVYHQLRIDILKCKLRPGEKLRFEPLKNSYGVGISPLREALSRLTSMRLVTAKGQHGFQVANVSIPELLDITKNRIWVQTIALRAAIAKGDRDWEANVLAAHHRLSGSIIDLGENSDDEWDQNHSDFHAALISACDSPQLIAYCNQMQDLSDRYRWLALTSGDGAKRDAGAEHAALMNAVLARDTALACEIIQTHLLQTTAILLSSDPTVGKDAPRMIEELRTDIKRGLL